MRQLDYDVIVVGGGTAGAVTARRLVDDERRVCVIEAGPSDVSNQRVLQLRRWLDLLGGNLDFDYGTTPQPHGNSHIRHARARVLGGCSSHNTMISLRPLPADFDAWVAAGAKGWSPVDMQHYGERLLNRFQPVVEKDHNPLCDAFVSSCSTALGVPIVSDFNAAPFVEGAGYLPVGYDPESGVRSSSSVSYLHSVLDKPNLTMLLETRAVRLQTEEGRATGVRVRSSTTGGEYTVPLAPGGTIVLAAGAIDTPRLLLLSGIGPAGDLDELGIGSVVDLPGVGENLLDHPEALVLWEASRPVPEPTVMHSDAGLFVRRDAVEPAPDLMFHLYTIPFTVNTERLGYPVPEHGFGMTPNIPRPRSAGRLSLTSDSPDDKPALDFRYLSDPDGYDARTLVEGVRIAREVAATAPFRDWIEREIAPGDDVVEDADIEDFVRRSHHTVYHPAGTCRMGAEDDALAVVTPDLRLRGVDNVMVADASIFPTMPTVNPMIAVFMIGERAADLVKG